jgi:hypothetical protein
MHLKRLVSLLKEGVLKLKYMHVFLVGCVYGSSSIREYLLGSGAQHTFGFYYSSIPR